MLKVGSFCMVRNVQQNNNTQIQGLTPTKEKKQHSASKVGCCKRQVWVDGYEKGSCHVC